MEDENAHIPTSEIEEDIRDTAREIDELRAAIRKREEFINKLQLLIRLRERP